MINKKFKKYLVTFLTGTMISSFFCVATIDANEISNIKASSEKATVKVIDTGKATIDGVSVRSKNSASGKYLGSLYTGDKVEIVEKTNNGWYKIKYKNSYAYVGKNFIKLSKTKSIDNVLNTGIVYNATKLTVRESCSTSSKVLGYLPKDTNVDIVRATSTNWYKIKYKNSYAYVKGNYIKLTPSIKVTSRGTISTTSVNVRKSASTSSTKLGTLNKGSRVQIIKKQSNGWYKIRYKDSDAYVSSTYVKLSNSNSSNRKNLNDFLFVGDSFTARMEKTIKSKNEMVYVHAQGGSRPSYWLDKVDEMPDKNSIDSVSLLIGVNGVTTSTNIVDTKALINQLVAKYPDKTIYVQKVFPVGKNFTENSPTSHNKAINKYNKQLKDFCSTKSNVKLIDATKDFVDSKGYLNSTSDGLHIDSSKELKFYNNIFSAIKSAEKN
ncbi:SH3 domain-containing protein [Terrisporobacter mayombei]|uniref:SH3b domain-containing protein n=1 Tax=Terrisporobacter mayombei TaxID=1541 RepID=A0ABY9Q477_9FIRM|nr:SH3 domain-containing protein [Terrisporobacter mayombei]MCC3867709.1 SH3 domain-containing protein [Terrisporobacter mayombei]WMT81971.1 hypothetical protein TEMA_23210 [Terrisporobacter mayombei]